jgi:hypothetical protein
MVPLAAEELAMVVDVEVQQTLTMMIRLTTIPSPVIVFLPGLIEIGTWLSGFRRVWGVWSFSSLYVASLAVAGGGSVARLRCLLQSSWANLGKVARRLLDLHLLDFLFRRTRLMTRMSAVYLWLGTLEMFYVRIILRIMK